MAILQGNAQLSFNKPEVAYLFPAIESGTKILSGVDADIFGVLFVFQYWPSQVNDSYEVNYAEKQIPGGSHPLYQWVSGNGRTISFEASFTSEIDEDSGVLGLGNVSLLPSSRYTVNVAAAINTLQSYQYPTYFKGDPTEPPRRLYLVLPGSRIGRSKDKDYVLCFLKSCRVTQESWFPSGTIRIATVALEFVETVQEVSSAGQTSSIQFIGASSFRDLSDYSYRGTFTS